MMLVYTKCQTPGGVFANLGLWLKSDAGTTVSGTDVLQWNDQSVHARAFSQATAGIQPTIAAITASTNYNPAVLFNGNQYLDATGSVLSPSTNSLIAVFNTSVTGYTDLLSVGKLAMVMALNTA